MMQDSHRFPAPRLWRRDRRPLQQIGVAQIADAAGSTISVLDLPLRRRTAATHVCGTVFQVQTDDDMLQCLQPSQLRERVSAVHRQHSRALGGAHRGHFR